MSRGEHVGRSAGRLLQLRSTAMVSWGHWRAARRGPARLTQLSSVTPSSQERERKRESLCLCVPVPLQFAFCPQLGLRCLGEDATATTTHATKSTPRSTSMTAPAGGGRAALRSLAGLLHRSPCAALSRLSATPAPYGGVRLHPALAPGTIPCGAGALRDHVRSMSRAVPFATSWGRQLHPRRGFLGIGDGDEDIGLAKHFEEDRVIGYTPEQVFDVVAGVDLYEDFVPWCQKSKVLWRTDDKMDAELEIGFKLFVERYISHVELKPPTFIKTTVSQSALFDFLNNEWHFKPGPSPNSCHLFFVVDFQFKSPLYRRVANMFFNEVQARLVGSFEERCQAVYGPSMETVMR